MGEFNLTKIDRMHGMDKVPIFSAYGTKSMITDFALLLGGEEYIDNLGRIYTDWVTRSTDRIGQVYYINNNGNVRCYDGKSPNMAIRPMLVLDNKIQHDCQAVFRNMDGIIELFYGTYPQFVVNNDLNSILEINYQNGLLHRTLNSINIVRNGEEDTYLNFPIYELNGEKYIRFIVDSFGCSKILSNGFYAKTGDVVWIKIDKIKWFLDEQYNTLIAQKSLIAGLSFFKAADTLKFYRFFEDFCQNNIYIFLNSQFANDILIDYKHNNKVDTLSRRRK